jgi:protein ImuB
LWLLAEPRRLAMIAGEPCLDGPLALKQGPERIETGWWDGQRVARDYYVAESPAGARLWVFRERRGEWYLHGVVG